MDLNIHPINSIPNATLWVNRPPQTGDAWHILSDGSVVGFKWAGGDVIAITKEFAMDCDPSALHFNFPIWYLGPYKIRVIGYDAAKEWFYCAYVSGGVRL